MVIGHGEEGFIYFAAGKGRPRRKLIDHYVIHEIDKPNGRKVLITDIYAGDCQYQMIHDFIVDGVTDYKVYFFKIILHYDPLYIVEVERKEIYDVTVNLY